MPKISNIFSSQFQRGADLVPHDVRIAGWRTETNYGREEYVLDLVGELPLRLTQTLGRDIGAALGEDDIDDWPERVVMIYPEERNIPDKDKDTGEKKLVHVIRAKKSARDKPPPKTPNRMADDDPDVINLEKIRQ